MDTTPRIRTITEAHRYQSELEEELSRHIPAEEVGEETLGRIRVLLDTMEALERVLLFTEISRTFVYNDVVFTVSSARIYLKNLQRMTDIFSRRPFINYTSVDGFNVTQASAEEKKFWDVFKHICDTTPLLAPV